MIKWRRKEMSKSTKIILAIVVVVALILIFDPFGGSDIEGEWEATVLKTANGSTKAYNALDPLSLVFYDDGTGDKIVYAGIHSFSYKCHGDTLVIDGEELQYEIKGDILKITDDEGTTLTLRRK